MCMIIYDILHKRANKMRLVSTKDKLVLFATGSWRRAMESAFRVWDFPFFIFLACSRKSCAWNFYVVILCQNSSREIPRESRLRERLALSRREKPAVWGGIFQPRATIATYHPPPMRHHQNIICWEAHHINNDFVLFRPAPVCGCVCVCASVNTIC